MKAKISRGSGFRGLFDYLLDEGPKATGLKKAEIVGGNLLGKTAADLAAEIAPIRQKKSECKKPVWHCSLSLPPGEKISSEIWGKISNRFLDLMKFSKHTPFVVVRHKDTDKDHVHLAISRIAIDGELWAGNFDVPAAIAAAAQIEREFSLTVTPSLASAKSENHRRPPVKVETEKSHRSGFRPPREEIQKLIDEILVAAPLTAPEFCQALGEAGVTCTPNLAVTGKLNGFSFCLADDPDKLYFSGSKLGARYKFSNLQKLGVTYTPAEDQAELEKFSPRHSTAPDLADSLAEKSPSAPKAKAPKKRPQNLDYIMYKSEQSEVRTELKQSRSDRTTARAALAANIKTRMAAIRASTKAAKAAIDEAPAVRKAEKARQKKVENFKLAQALESAKILNEREWNSFNLFWAEVQAEIKSKLINFKKWKEHQSPDSCSLAPPPDHPRLSFPDSPPPAVTQGISNFHIVSIPPPAGDPATLFFAAVPDGPVVMADLGNKIDIYKPDRETILAALQIAQNKWGGAKFEGPPENLLLAMELAQQYKIKLHNPEFEKFKLDHTPPPAPRAEKVAKTVTAEAVATPKVEKAATTAAETAPSAKGSFKPQATGYTREALDSAAHLKDVELKIENRNLRQQRNDLFEIFSALTAEAYRADENDYLPREKCQYFANSFDYILTQAANLKLEQKFLSEINDHLDHWLARVDELPPPVVSPTASAQPQALPIRAAEASAPPEAAAEASPSSSPEPTWAPGTTDLMKTAWASAQPGEAVQWLRDVPSPAGDPPAYTPRPGPVAPGGRTRRDWTVTKK